MYDTTVPEDSTQGPDVQNIDVGQIGHTIYPLLCISVHEHAWMAAGRGVWGKEEYLKRFWDVVDWEKVTENYDRYRGPAGTPFR
jgi:Fe-Mn family superoxide dismutase